MTGKNFWTRRWVEATSSCERASASSRSASAAAVRPSISLALVLMLVPVWVLLMPSALHANSITVNTTADPGTSKECSLRAAINNANNKTSSSSSACAAGTGTDTIVFSISGIIRLGSTLPTIENTLTINGSGAITVSGEGNYEVLSVNSGATLNLDYLTIADGSAPEEGLGGGILNDGTLTVTNSTFSDNFADQGGGIFNQGGTLTVTNSTFSGNSAFDYGGGICDHGRTLTVIANSTFSKNSAGFDGGGILTGGTLTVTNSTFSGNSSADAYLSGGGGGIANIGTLAVTNSTFSKNSAKNGGGGISSTGTASVTNSTFAGNSASTSASASSFAGGGGILTGGTLTVSNSTFLANGAPPGSGGGIENNDGSTTVSNSILTKSPGGNCAVYAGTIDNGGYNISNDGTCGFGRSTGANGRTIGDNVTPLLKALANNGGPTKTIALQPKSPAIDAIPIDLCPATDQRGFPRPDPASPPETACDIGAFESGSYSKTSD